MLKILDYREDLKDYFKTLNFEWLEKYFKIEPIDYTILLNPEEEIISKGGKIFFAEYENKIVGVVALIKIDDSQFELSKMAVKSEFQGLKIGNKLIEKCINYASENNYEKIILYSNTILKPAIHLYKKFGFNEVEFESGSYARTNIKMEKILSKG